MTELTRKEQVDLERRIDRGNITLRRTESLFSALCKDHDIEVSHGGSTFAVSAKGGFSYFVAINAVNKFHEYYMQYERYLTGLEDEVFNKTLLRLPGPHAIGNLNPEAAEAAGLHESGHVRRDRIGVLSYEEFRDISITFADKVKIDKDKFKRIMNLLADVRLERLDVREWPRTLSKYGALQEWCWELESETRAQVKEPLVQCMIRDYGKAHPSPSRERVLSEYSERTHEMFADMKWIIDEFIDRFLDDPEDRTLTFLYAVKISSYICGDEVQEEKTPSDGPSEEKTPSDDQSEDDPSEDDPSDDGQSEDDPSEEGPSKDGPSEDGPSKDDQSEEGPSKDGPSEDGPSKEGPSKDGPSKDDQSGDDQSEDVVDGTSDETSSNEDENTGESVGRVTSYSIKSWSDALDKDALDPSSAMDSYAKTEILWSAPASISYSDF